MCWSLHWMDAHLLHVAYISRPLYAQLPACLHMHLGLHCTHLVLCEHGSRAVLGILACLGWSIPQSAVVLLTAPAAGNWKIHKVCSTKHTSSVGVWHACTASQL